MKSQLAALSRRHEAELAFIRREHAAVLKQYEKAYTDLQAKWGHDQVHRDALEHELEKVIKNQVSDLARLRVDLEAEKARARRSVGTVRAEMAEMAKVHAEILSDLVEGTTEKAETRLH